MGSLEVSFGLRIFAGLFDPDADPSESSLALRFPKLTVDVEPDVGGLWSELFRVNPSEETKISCEPSSMKTLTR